MIEGISDDVIPGLEIPTGNLLLWLFSFIFCLGHALEKEAVTIKLFKLMVADVDKNSCEGDKNFETFRPPDSPQNNWQTISTRTKIGKLSKDSTQIQPDSCNLIPSQATKRTGTPLVYELDADLKPIASPLAVEPLKWPSCKRTSGIRDAKGLK